LDRVDVDGGPLDLDVDRGTVWVPANGSGTLWMIDVATGVRTEGPALVPGIFVAQVLAGDVWVLDFSGDDVYRVPA